MQGWSDSELTPDGLAGVRAAADHLREVDLTAAWASPAGRTVTTAREILRHHPGVELVTDARLREMSFGDYEEQPEVSLAALGDPVAVFREVFDGTFVGFPGGEPGSVYLSRVARGFRAIERAHQDGGTVLVVGHGVTLMAYLRLIGTVPRRPLANASVTTVRVDPDGARTVLEAGFDPTGSSGLELDLSQRAARVALEEAALWHPDTDLGPDDSAV